MKRTLFLLVVGATLLAGTAGDAHHSFAATYHEDKLEMIEGEIVQFLYRNPHSFVHVMAPDAQGKMQRWSIEWGAISQLNRQGVERYTLKIGDHVQITGAPARNPDDHRLLLRRLLRPSDGFKWAAQVG